MKSTKPVVTSGISSITFPVEPLRTQANNSMIERMHAAADYEALRARSLLEANSAVAQLQSVITALGRTPPKLSISLDVLNSLLCDLRKHENYLTELRVVALDAPNPAVVGLAQSIISNTIANSKTCGHDWPKGADYALHYNLSSWPVGWQRDSCIEFFPTLEELTKKINDLCEWTKCEDNFIAYQAYCWDLGPEKMSECNDTGNLTMTLKERDAAAGRG